MTLLRPLCSWVVSISKDKNTTAALGNQFQYLATLRVKYFSLHPTAISCVPTHPGSSHPLSAGPVTLQDSLTLPSLTPPIRHSSTALRRPPGFLFKSSTNPVLASHALHLPHHFSGPLLNCSSKLVSLVLGTQTGQSTVSSRSHDCHIQGTSHSLGLLQFQSC